jgi:hypothetical protein
MKVKQGLGVVALIFIFSAPAVSEELLFSNFDGDPFGGNLYTSGGPCDSACFAIEDNFSNAVPWEVTGFTFYMVSPLDSVSVGMNGRFALFTAADVEVVAPTNTALTVTDMGITFEGEGYRTYKLEITGLSIALSAGEYRFRFTNTNSQGIFPGYGNPSAQAVDPGLVQLTGSQSVEPLLSTDRSQRDGSWAFQVFGPDDTTFEDGFETD